MANSYTFTADKTVTVGAATKKTDIDLVAANTDYLKEALDTIMSSSAADGNISTTGTLAAGATTITGVLKSNANDGGALGASGTGWSDLFLASGGVINWAAGNVTLTQSSGVLTMLAAGDAYLRVESSTDDFPGSGASPQIDIGVAGTGSTSYGYISASDGTGLNELRINASNLYNGTNDGGALGKSGNAWSDLFLASGGVINWAAGNVTLTHLSNALAIEGGNLGIGTSTFGTSAAGTLHLANGTQASTAAANTVSLVSEDLSAANTTLSIRTEGTGTSTNGTTTIGTGTPTANRTINIKVNGTVYALIASTSFA